jgi:hypothetical protein
VIDVKSIPGPLFISVTGQCTVEAIAEPIDYKTNVDEMKKEWVPSAERIE